MRGLSRREDARDTSLAETEQEISTCQCKHVVAKTGGVSHRHYCRKLDNVTSKILNPLQS